MGRRSTIKTNEHALHGACFSPAVKNCVAPARRVLDDGVCPEPAIAKCLTGKSDAALPSAAQSPRKLNSLLSSRRSVVPSSAIRSSVAVSFLVLALPLGCALPQQAPPKAPEPTQLTVKVPKFAPIKEGSETQDRGGVVVQMEPPLFNIDRTTKTTCTQQQEMLVTNGQYLYEVRETPQYSVSPPNADFKIKVTNHSTQVLKLAGTIFKLVLDGKEVALDQAGYKTFTDGILTPNEAKEFTVPGPRWDSLPESATVSFQIFSLPVAFDDAGNVTKRDNFDWTFAFKVEPTQKDDQIKIESVRMTNEQKQARCPA
jgi:hypothetical protein